MSLKYLNWIWYLISWAFKFKLLKAHNLSDKGGFSFHYSLATSTTNWVQIFTGLLFYACWDTPSEKTGLWQLPKVSSVLKIVADPAIIYIKFSAAPALRQMTWWLETWLIFYFFTADRSVDSDFPVGFWPTYSSCYTVQAYNVTCAKCKT